MTWNENTIRDKDTSNAEHINHKRNERGRYLCPCSPSQLTAATLGTDAYSYSYDNIGNRKTAQEAAEEATAYDANNLNQYTSIQEGTAEAFVPTFDADGNQTKVKTSTGIWNVVYNAENRPVTFTSEDGATVVECTYDYMGRRHTRKITVNGSVTNYLRYIYRGYLQIAAINAVSGVFQWFILWDPTQPVATRPLGIRKDGTWYTYGWDLTKNICEVFGSDGYIKTAYTYTPYGAVTANGNVTQPIQWSSEYNDSELGLIYYNYRHYNPTDGRWIGRDVVAETLYLNRYTYAYNTPYFEIDFCGAFAPLALVVIRAISGAAIDFGLQMLDNHINDRPLMDIDESDVILSAAVGAIPFSCTANVTTRTVEIAPKLWRAWLRSLSVNSINFYKKKQRKKFKKIVDRSLQKYNDLLNAFLYEINVEIQKRYAIYVEDQVKLLFITHYGMPIISQGINEIGDRITTTLSEIEQSGRYLFDKTREAVVDTYDEMKREIKKTTESIKNFFSSLF